MKTEIWIGKEKGQIIRERNTTHKRNKANYKLIRLQHKAQPDLTRATVDS